MEEQVTETFLIHVPQGRTARLIRDSLEIHGVEGLHTNGFSTCNIIVCIGKDKITLTHADQRTSFPKIKADIIWIGEPSQIIIISKESGKVVLDYLLRSFRDELPDKKVSTQRVDDAHYGIIVSFKEQSVNNFHPQVTTLPISENPKNLLHHPEEERFLTVHKMEGIIGFRASFITQRTLLYTQLIFDGRGWEAIDEAEFTIDDRHEMTKDEMERLTDCDNYYAICCLLKKIYESALKYAPGPSDSRIIEEDVSHVAIYAEGYLNKYHALIPFIKNIKKIISEDVYTPISIEDRNLKNELLRVLNNNNCDFKIIQSLFDAYEKNAPINNYKTDLLIEFRMISRHYHNRVMYREMDSFLQKKVSVCISANERADRHFQAKEYDAALKLFRYALKIATMCCLKNNPVLAKCYFNLGKCLQQLSRYNEAILFLDYSLELTKRSTHPREWLSALNKVKKVLEECNKHIKAPNSTNSSSNKRSFALV